VSSSRARVSHHRGAAQNSAWTLWSSFCQGLGLDAYLSAVPDKLPFLLLFAHSYRHGHGAPGGHPVRSRTVEDAVRAVGQAFASLGAVDPRLNSHGALDLRLTSLLRSWARADAPPSRVRPVPVGLIHTAWALAAADRSLACTTTATCAAIAFYFLLRPGEYVGAPRAADALFRVRDVGLWQGTTRLDPLTCPDPSLDIVTFVSLTFSRQKNGTRGESTGHAPSGDPTLCPVRLLVARLRALRDASAAPDTPLNAFRASPLDPWAYVMGPQVTSLLRAAAAAAPHLGISPSQVSARSLRSGGAVALLCGGVDADRIRLLGRWRSDAMFRYLHTQAPPVMAGLAPAMLRGGHFHLTPSFSHPSGSSPSARSPTLTSPWSSRGDPDLTDRDTPYGPEEGGT
jgi:hypothetical protein